MKRTSTAVVGLLIGALAPAGVWAQGSGNAPQPASERRPFRGIFGSPSSPNTPQSLVLSGSLFGSHDDNVLAGLTDSNSQDWRVQRSGTYGAAHAGLDYAFSRTGTRVSFGAQTGAQVRYYRHTDLSNVAPHYNAGANLRLSLSRSTTLSADHQVVYSRQYRLSTFPAAGEAFAEDVSSVANPDYELFQLPSLRNSTRVSFTQNFGRRASLTAGYSLRSIDFLDDTADEQAVNRQLRDYRSQSASIGFQYSRPFTSYASLNLGYRLRISDSQQGTGEPPAMHNVNAGLSYARALSFSRRTSLSVSTGSAVAVSDRVSALESEPRTRVRLTGNAALVHELGRTWTAQVAYNRGFTFHEGFDEPFFTDGVTAGIGGLVTRRLSFSAGGVWALSELNGGGRAGHTGFSGSARSTYALNRYLALFAQYVYYQYEFGGDVPLDPLVPRALDRQGVRVGITTSVPLLR